jgi:hypothetical protein
MATMERCCGWTNKVGIMSQIRLIYRLTILTRIFISYHLTSKALLVSCTAKKPRVEPPRCCSLSARTTSLRSPQLPFKTGTPMPPTSIVIMDYWLSVSSIKSTCSWTLRPSMAIPFKDLSFRTTGNQYPMHPWSKVAAKVSPFFSAPLSKSSSLSICRPILMGPHRQSSFPNLKLASHLPASRETVCWSSSKAQPSISIVCPLISWSIPKQLNLLTHHFATTMISLTQ